MVEAVNCFGEWGGRTVSPHPHAHSTTVLDFTMAGEKISRSLQFWDLMILLLIPHAQAVGVLVSRRHFSWLHEFAKHPRTAISRPPGSCSPSHTSNCLLIVFTHRNFPGFTHAVFPLRIGEWCGSVHCSEADLWVLHCGFSCTGHETVKFVPSMVCVHFPQ